jgi:hypothetical protein
MKKVLLLGLILLVAAPPVHAQTKLARAKAGMPKDAARQLEQLVTAARTRGLPTEPLVDKALEGVAKGVAPNVIINAVRRRSELVAKADAALRPFGPPTAAEVTAAADVMQRGLSADVIKRVRAGRRNGEPVGVSLHTVAQLVDRKVPPKVALDLLNSWRHGRARNEDLRELASYVDRLIRTGSSPAAAARSVGSALQQGRRPPVNSTQIEEKTSSGDEMPPEQTVSGQRGGSARDRASAAMNKQPPRRPGN